MLGNGEKRADNRSNEKTKYELLGFNYENCWKRSYLKERLNRVYNDSLERSHLFYSSVNSTAND